MYKVGMLCKFYKGSNLLEKNIYEILELNVKGIDIASRIESIAYSGNNELEVSTGLVVYKNIFQNRLFARELSDLENELSPEVQKECGQKFRVEPLTESEIKEISSKEFIKLKMRVEKAKELKAEKAKQQILFNK